MLMRDDCSPFYDCEGTLFGHVDCNGDCNGEALVGDLDYNGAQEYQSRSIRRRNPWR